MIAAKARQTLHEAIEAHGGMTYWQSLTALVAIEIHNLTPIPV